MKIFQLSDCFNNSDYKWKIINALSNQNERRKLTFTELGENISSNNYLYAKFFEDGDDYGLCIAKPSDWDSDIINKKCLKIIYCFSTSYSTAQNILNDFFESIPKDIYFISYDNNLSPSFQDITFEEKGFHIGLHYYDWVGDSDKIDKGFLNFHKRFNLILANSKHINQLRTLSESFPGPGRFSSDPYLKTFAAKIYSEWITNSVNDLRQKVVTYIRNDMIQGYISYGLPSKDATSLGILRLNESLDIGIISYALLSFACDDIFSQGCKKIFSGTSKNNQPINKIYSKNGFRLIDSGIQFHWINKSMI